MIDQLNCQTVAALISADLDGLLSQADQRTLDSHLQGCGACTTLREQFLFIQRCSLHGRIPRLIGPLQ